MSFDCGALLRVKFPLVVVSRKTAAGRHLFPSFQHKTMTSTIASTMVVLDLTHVFSFTSFGKGLFIILLLEGLSKPFRMLIWFIFEEQEQQVSTSLCIYTGITSVLNISTKIYDGNV